MRTSRISKETAKIIALTAPRPQTRASALAASTSTRRPRVNAGTTAVAGFDGANDDEHDDSSDDGKSLSSLSSAAFSNVSFDIEDAPIPSRALKRKRGAATPSTPASIVAGRSSVLAQKTKTTTTRTSPRKTQIKTEEEVEVKVERDLSGGAGGVGRVKKARRQPAKQETNEETGEVTVHPPANWQEIYSAVQEMRRKVLAPVDTMGCERLADEHLTPKDRRFQTLIALMLSSQTKDTTNAQTMNRLKTELPHPGLTLQNILEVEPARLNELIWAVGFHNNKTRFIKAAAEILRDSYDGDIPDTPEELMKLPGVGPKMAYLVMSAAWQKTLGIGVDVHVHRITNLWGWHRTREPEQTRLALQAWLPRDRWHEINHLLVGFGQTICKPVGRDCSQCTLSSSGLCPSAVVRRETKVKRFKAEGTVDRHVKVEAGSIRVKEEEVTVDVVDQVDG